MSIHDYTGPAVAERAQRILPALREGVRAQQSGAGTPAEQEAVQSFLRVTRESDPVVLDAAHALLSLEEYTGTPVQ